MRANYSVESCLLLNQSTASRTIENIEILTTLFHFLRQHMNSIFFRNVFFARNVVLYSMYELGGAIVWNYVCMYVYARMELVHSTNVSQRVHIHVLLPELSGWLFPWPYLVGRYLVPSCHVKYIYSYTIEENVSRKCICYLSLSGLPICFPDDQF